MRQPRAETLPSLHTCPFRRPRENGDNLTSHPGLSLPTYRLAISVTVRPRKKNREKNRTKNHALPFDIFFSF